MEESMKEEINISEFRNKENNRRATVSKDEYHFIVRCYHKNELMFTELLEDKSIHYAEDLAENYVDGYGVFKVGNTSN